jgi:hypothetical protein
LLDLPVGTLHVLDGRPRDLALLVLGQRPAHPPNEAEALPQAHYDAQSRFVGLTPHDGNSGTLSTIILSIDPQRQRLSSPSIVRVELAHQFQYLIIAHPHRSQQANFYKKSSLLFENENIT